MHGHATCSWSSIVADQLQDLKQIRVGNQIWSPKPSGFYDVENWARIYSHLCDGMYEDPCVHVYRTTLGQPDSSEGVVRSLYLLDHDVILARIECG